MKPDIKRIEYSIKGNNLIRPLIKYFYAPIARKFIYIIALLNLPIWLVNVLTLLFLIISSYIVYFHSNLMWLAGIFIFIAFISNLSDGAWARYNKKTSLYGEWLNNSNGILGMFFVFLTGALITFNSTQKVSIFIGFSLALFAYLMMNYSAVFVRLIHYKYKLEEDLSEMLRASLSDKTKIPRNYLSLSFEYQWTLIILAVTLNQFEILFWIFAILGNLQWITKYYLLSGK